MEQEMIQISKEEYKRLKKLEKVDNALLQDIANGIKDILGGRIKEV